MTSLRYLLLAVFVSLAACGRGLPEVHEYQIVVNGSATPEPVQFTGSFACRTNGKELTRDISGTGTQTTSFQCERLLHVRIQRVLGAGLVSLSVYKDGEAVFVTPPTDSVIPFVYVPRSEER